MWATFVKVPEISCHPAWRRNFSPAKNMTSMTFFNLLGGTFVSVQHNLERAYLDKLKNDFAVIIFVVHPLHI
jgi:hypothetical protein